MRSRGLGYVSQRQFEEVIIIGGVVLLVFVFLVVAVVLSIFVAADIDAFQRIILFRFSHGGGTLGLFLGHGDSLRVAAGIIIVYLSK